MTELWRDEWRRVDSRWGPMVVNRFDYYIGRSFLHYGEFSPDEVDFLRDLVHLGDVVVDVGANIGALTVPLALEVGAGGRLLAFEPQPAIAELLALNVEACTPGNVIIEHCALGAAPGGIVVPPVHYDQIGNFGGLELQREGPGTAVPLRTLDSYELDRIRLLKIDVEGMEADVLSGAAATIQRCRPILYVENDRPAKTSALIDLIEALPGYRWSWHKPRLYRPGNYFQNPANLFGGTISLNMLCEPMR